jgi:hypothetical protein
VLLSPAFQAWQHRERKPPWRATCRIRVTHRGVAAFTRVAPRDLWSCQSARSVLRLILRRSSSTSLRELPAISPGTTRRAVRQALWAQMTPDGARRDCARTQQGRDAVGPIVYAGNNFGDRPRNLR